jgi:hypothetical protein
MENNSSNRGMIRLAIAIEKSAFLITVGLLFIGVSLTIEDGPYFIIMSGAAASIVICNILTWSKQPPKNSKRV